MPKLENVLFELRMQEKTLERESKRAEKEHLALTAKVKKAIAEKRIEFAQIHAESAVRKRNESLNYLRLASRLNAVGSRIRTASSVQNVTKELGKVTKGMEKAMKTMNLEKMTVTMDNFEKQFENLDLLDNFIEDTMHVALTTGGATAEVDALMSKVAAENDLQEQLAIMKAPEAKKSSDISKSTEADDLSNRLQALRN